MASRASQQASITASESFAFRAQTIEQSRIAVWAATLTFELALNIARRVFGGVVMATNSVFWPRTFILCGAIALQIVVFRRTRSANRKGQLLPAALWRGLAFVDLLTALAPLIVSFAFSPRGPLTALTAPPLLLLPIVILLSVLRLRPRLTLLIGTLGATVHFGLTLAALLLTHASTDQYPVYLAYSVLLGFTAIAGSLVCRSMRQHVLSVSEESAARLFAEHQTGLLQREMNIAGDIQKHLLPAAPPRFEGFDIAGASHPADMAGGDYFDWQLLPDGRLLTVVADVSGHGIGPALMMAVCRAYTRASADTISDPSPFMRRLNRLLESDMPAGRFITFVVATLDRDGEVQLLSAGHGPTLFYNSETHQTTTYGGDGVPLGVLPGEDYTPPTKLVMRENDVLVLATDGYFEWARAGDEEQFGIRRLRNCIAENAGGTAEEILANLDSAVRAFSAGSKQADDTTALIIKRNTK